MNITINIIGFIIFLFTILLFLVLVLRLIIFFIKKKNFPKKLLIATLTGAILFSGLFIYINYFFTFNSINREYTQPGLGAVLSPTEKYTANSYYEPYGGVLGGVNVWVEIVNNEEDGKIKIVYYGDAKNTFTMNWIDDETLSIVNDSPNYPNSNRSIELKVDKEIYHENGLACNSVLMKDEYEKCFENN